LIDRETLDDIRQRIAAIALIYRTLYQGPNLRQVDLKSFLEDLTAQLVMSESLRGHAVDTNLTADHLSVDPDRLAPWPCLPSRRSPTPRSTPSMVAAASCSSGFQPTANRPALKSKTLATAIRTARLRGFARASAGY